MLVELSIIPLNGSTHISGEIAKALTIIADSGLPYQLTAAGTCIEGEWSEVMDLIERCHREVRKTAPHVITTIRVEDEEGATNKLEQNVISVQQKGGRNFDR